MQNFKHIDISGTKVLIEQGATVFDIRDPVSFENGHIAGASHLTNDNIQQSITQTATDKPVIVYCYHGISSQQAAQYFVAQGFEDVYSMDGGFEAWRQTEPTNS